MLVLAWRAILLGFLIAGLVHVAAAITVMFFDDHHSMAATVVRSILITVIIAPVLFYVLSQKGSQEPERDAI
ncbi:hypothetical protein ACLIR7_09745 [Nitratireductor aquimarinus]|uniref:hypothetical protein n=1 Tax=Nitratireductor aquimarinus TaxID=889300 RepID=UPI00398E6CF0